RPARAPGRGGGGGGGGGGGPCKRRPLPPDPSPPSSGARGARRSDTNQRTMNEVDLAATSRRPCRWSVVRGPWSVDFLPMPAGRPAPGQVLFERRFLEAALAAVGAAVAEAAAGRPARGRRHRALDARQPAPLPEPRPA